jgi:hypothetical protein
MKQNQHGDKGRGAYPTGAEGRFRHLADYAITASTALAGRPVRTQ